MSKLGFHPDPLSKPRAVPRPLGAASAPLLSVFGSRDAMLAHPLDVHFLCNAHQQWPLRSSVRRGGYSSPGEEGVVRHAFPLPPRTVHQPDEKGMPAHVSRLPPLSQDGFLSRKVRRPES